MKTRTSLQSLALSLPSAAGALAQGSGPAALLNVSRDPTRERYAETHAAKDHFADGAIFEQIYVKP